SCACFHRTVYRAVSPTRSRDASVPRRALPASVLDEWHQAILSVPQSKPSQGATSPGVHVRAGWTAQSYQMFFARARPFLGKGAAPQLDVGSRAQAAIDELQPRPNYEPRCGASALWIGVARAS